MADFINCKFSHFMADFINCKFSHLTTDTIANKNRKTMPILTKPKHLIIMLVET